MRLTRRRFLAISAVAGAGALALRAPVTRWQGLALGADAHIEIRGDRESAEEALSAARDTLNRMEKLFSIYDPGSAISKFNAHGELLMPPEFARLARLCSRLHEDTGGLFDPTIQPVFAAAIKAGGLSHLSEQNNYSPGWSSVRIEGQRLLADHDRVALTFNGIAQGFAADRVFETLVAHGMENVLVDTGELRIGAGNRRIGIDNDNGLRLGLLDGAHMAVATSSARSYTFADGTSHIIDPRAPHRTLHWKTVSVQTGDAATADGLSTALMLTTSDEGLVRIAKLAGGLSVIAERADGTVLRMGNA